MEARSLFRLPTSFRGCLRAQSTRAFGARRHVSSSSEPPSQPDATATEPAQVAASSPASQQSSGNVAQARRNATRRFASSRQPAADDSPLPNILRSWRLSTAEKSPTTTTNTTQAENASGLRNLADSTRPLEDYSQRELPRLAEHHLHIFATKHNCHITLAEPSVETPKGPRRRKILTLSSGNIGFRKAARGTYDAAFQLGSYMMSRIQNQGLLAEIQRLEVVFRGFGQGREALQKVLLGVEGAALRNRVVRVVDSTRLKFGGPRSKKPRRLG